MYNILLITVFHIFIISCVYAFRINAYIKIKNFLEIIPVPMIIDPLSLILIVLIKFWIFFFFYLQVRKSSFLFYSSGTMEQSSRNYHWTFSSGYYYKRYVFEIDICVNSYILIFILRFIFKLFVIFYFSLYLYMLFLFRKLRLFARFITPADSFGVQ